MDTTESIDFYNQDYLINRAYTKLKNINNDNKKIFCKPEIINHNRKSYISNFIKFCDSINRNPEDVKKFIDNDMSTLTSIINDNNMDDEKSGLKFNNMYRATIIMTSITNYMKQNVLCSLCKSGNTEIKKINKITYICCNNCKADKSI